MILVELSHLWQKPMKSYEIYTLFLLCLLRREEEVPPKILVLPNSQEYLERWEHTICTRPGYVLSRKVMSTTCNPMDCSPPGSSVRGILQARILECAAMPSSRGSSQTRDQTRISMSPALAGGLFTTTASCVAWEEEKKKSREGRGGKDIDGSLGVIFGERGKIFKEDF